MAPLVLEGLTLGEKHRQYNSVLKAATTDQTLKLESINYEDSDIDNLFRIDIACSRRDTQYILDVLTCDDMLYVTRAINRSTWLITEDKYAHIINPKYLNDILFSKMTAKAKNKFLLTIRLHLANSTRVEEFFNFYKSDINVAQKWLPKCSPTFIRNIVEKDIGDLDSKILIRLCENSFELFKYIVKTSTYCYNKRNVLEKCIFLLKNNTIEYLDVFDSLEHYEKTSFGKKATQIIMSTCSDRIITNFAKYCHHIDIPTFAHNMKKEEIQKFLLKQKNDVALKNWFRFANVKPFIKYLPKENKFEFVKSLALGRTDPGEDDTLVQNDYISARAQCAMPISGGFGGRIRNNSHIYRWYRYAPFNTALPELKKLLHVESNPSERTAILTILIHSAGSNQKYIKTLLEFYREKHLNEPFKFKIQFVNSLLSLTKTHQYDDDTWSILNDIFSSMEVYIESENNVPFCIQAIIVYHLLHNQKIPDIVQTKLKFSTFKDYRNKININEQRILFSYLYDQIVTKINNQQITNEAEIETALNTLQQAIELLSDWDKSIVDYPAIVNKIKELAHLKEQVTWDIDLTNVYKICKKWRRHLFEESITLNPSEETCLNALKHNPELLSRYDKEVRALFFKHSVSLKRVCRKLRIYWATTIAQLWTKIFLDHLLQLKGQKSVLKNFCTITPQNEILPLIKQYAPADTKINWADFNDHNINLRKNIAQNMHLVRPSLSLETVLLYAKEDYLLFTLPSLCSILYNMSPQQTSNYVMKLFDAPVSLQKHGIRTAFEKLNINDIKEIVQGVWRKTKNSSIKTVLFQQTFQMLSKAKNPTTVNNIWEVLSMYIDGLTHEENRIIYNIFVKSNLLPLAVRPAFFMKGYLYLKSLPPKAKCEGILSSLNDQAAEIMHLLDPPFVENILLEAAEDKIVTKNFKMKINSTFNILSSYLLSSNTEALQTSKYEKLLLPLLENSFAIWGQRYKGNYYIKTNIASFLSTLISDLSKYTVTKKFIIPVKLFKDIETKIHDTLPVVDNYNMIINWRITVLFVEELDNYLRANPISETEIEEPSTKCTSQGCSPADEKTWSTICTKVTETFGHSLLTFLKQETLLDHHQCLYSCVAEQLMNNLDTLQLSNLDKYQIIKTLLSDKNASTMYCIAIGSLRSMEYYYSEEDKTQKREINRTIRSCPSPEVKILFNHLMNSSVNEDCENDDEPDEIVVKPFKAA